MRLVRFLPYNIYETANNDNNDENAYKCIIKRWLLFHKSMRLGRISNEKGKNDAAPYRNDLQPVHVY